MQEFESMVEDFKKQIALVVLLVSIAVVAIFLI